MVIDRDKHNKYVVTGFVPAGTTLTTPSTSSVPSSTTIIYQGGGSGISEELANKLEGIEEGAQVNLNAFSFVTIKDEESEQVLIEALNPTDTLKITSLRPIKLDLVDNSILISYSDNAELWYLDDEGNLWTDRNVYSTKEISAWGLGEGEEPSGKSYLHELLDVSANNPSNGAILLYNSSTLMWEATASVNLEGYATQLWVTTQINNLIGAAPGALDTLLELAAALGNDPNFATTITNMISAIDARVDTVEDKIADLLDWFSFVDGKIRANYDFFGVGEVSAYGLGEGTAPTIKEYLKDLLDVLFTNLASGLLLQYNGSKWVNIDKDEVGLNESELANYLTTNNYALISDITWANLSGKPSIFTTNIGSITDLNSGWDSILASAPTNYVTRWPLFAEVTNKPTTLAGYGITDALSTTLSDERYVNVTGDTMTGNLILPTLLANTSIILGSVKLEYDSVNKALKVSNVDSDDIINLYATGEVAAYGYGSTGGGGFINSLGDIEDVVLTGLTTNDMLMWDGTNWVNIPMSDISVSSDDFVTIATALTITASKTFTQPIKVNVSSDTPCQEGLSFYNGSTILGAIGAVHNGSTIQWMQLNPNGVLDGVGGLVIGEELGFNGYLVFHSGNTIIPDVGNFALANGTNATGTWPISISNQAGYLRSYDTRGVNNTPTSFNSGARFEFKLNSVNGISDSGMYNGILYFRPYGANADISGGVAHELSFTMLGNLWHRYGTSATAWGAWSKLIDSSNIGSYALTPSNYTSTLDSRYVNVSGDTMTGLLLVPSVVATSNTVLLGDTSYTNGRLLYSDGTFYIQSSASGKMILAGRNMTSLTDFNIQVSSHSVATINDSVIWTAGNDGSGSGLDADLLDGYNSTDYDLSTVLSTPNDYGQYVIGLLQITGYTTAGNMARGRLIFTRSNGNNNVCTIFYDLSTYYNTTNVRFGWLALGIGGAGISPVTFTYNGNKWAGFRMTSSSQYGAGVTVTRVGKRIGEKSTPFSLLYYTSNTSTINNSEVYNSIVANGSDIILCGAMSTTFYGSFSGNATSASHLATARTIWGQSFDGTANVSGNMTGVGTITSSAGISSNWNDVWSDGSANHPWYGLSLNGPANNYQVTLSGYYGMTFRTASGWIAMLSNGNVGIGTVSPSYKLHVSGTIYASDIILSASWLYSNGSTGWYNNTYGGGMYMTDTTWVRTYLQKSFYTGSGTIRSDYAFDRLGYAGSSWNYGYGSYNTAITNNSSLTPLLLAYRAGAGASATGSNRLFVMELLNSGYLMNICFGGAYKFIMYNTGNFVATGEITAYSSSDIRLKTNIKHLSAIDVVRKMNIVEYDWNETALELKADKTVHGYGLIALEVQLLIPEIVSTNMYDKGYLGIDYLKLVPFALSAIQEVDDEVTMLKKRVTELEYRLSKYEHIN